MFRASGDEPLGEVARGMSGFTELNKIIWKHVAHSIDDLEKFSGLLGTKV